MARAVPVAVMARAVPVAAMARVVPAHVVVARAVPVAVMARVVPVHVVMARVPLLAARTPALGPRRVRQRHRERRRGGDREEKGPSRHRLPRHRDSSALVVC
jgi:hypothetical protein